MKDLMQERENAKRAADQAHRESIHAEIVEDLERELTPLEGMGWAAGVDVIASGRIRHLSITY